MSSNAFKKWLGISVTTFLLFSIDGVKAYEFGCVDPSQQAKSRLLMGPIESLTGDTVKVGSFTLGLLSIKAPPIGTDCKDRDQKSFDCGLFVREQLDKMVKAAASEAICIVHSEATESRGYGFCGVLGADGCLEKDFGAELAKAHYVGVTAIGEVPFSSYYWDGLRAMGAKRGLYSTHVLR
jgi:hypothetical protein|nr:hypothetical protein [uncultured Dongia sp.]